MKKHNSAVSICQPSCGYYFSSGYFISENCSAGYYASDGSSTLYSHGALYNAVSRIVVDGGRKAIAYMAMAGMLTQNLEIAAYAEVPEAAVYHISRYIPPETEYTGTNTDGTQYTINGSKIIGYSIDRGWLNISAGGSALNTIVNNGFLNLSNGAIIYDTQLNNGKVRVYDGGTAATTTINGGTQAIYSGGIALNAIINAGGSQLIYSSGIASDTIINAGGFQQVYSGGSAIGFTVAEGGTQVLDEGAVAVSAIIIGDQYVFSGATTENIAVKTGAQHILSKGSAISTLLSEDGQQIVSEGGYAGNTTINAYGIQTVLENGVAQNANVEFGGKQIINSGSADGTTVKSGGVLSVIAGEATDIAQNIGGAIIAAVSGDDGIKINGIYNDDTAINFSQENGIANNFVIENGGVQNVGAGGTANYTVINATGTQNIQNGGIANDTRVNVSGIQNILDGGSAKGTVLNGGIGASFSSRPTQNISDGGIATDTVLEVNGVQNVYEGGIADNTVIKASGVLSMFGGSALNVSQSAGGQITAHVAKNGTKYDYINEYVAGEYYSVDGGTRAFLLAEGSAANFTLTGGQLLVSSGGVARDTILDSGGVQKIGNNGSAELTEIHKGSEFVLKGGTATATTVYALGSQVLGSNGGAGITSGGYAESTILMDGGSQIIYAGGIANYTSVNAGGTQNIQTDGTANNAVVSGSGYVYANQNVYGKALSTVVYGRGKQNVSAGGTADYTSVMADGTQNVYGTANNTYINYGGTQNVQTGGTVYDTVLSGSGTRKAQQDVNGTAYDTQITSGTQNVYGSAMRTSLFAGGRQGVGTDGTAESTYIYQGGEQNVYYGIATDTIISDGGTQNVYSDGTANNTSVNYGGIQVVSGTANNAVLGNAEILEEYPNSAVQSVYGNVSGTSIYALGIQNVYETGVATSTVIYDGGWQHVVGIATGTVINAGGSQTVNGGGTAHYTIVKSGGIQRINAYGNGSAISTTVSSGGSQTIASGTAYYTVIKATGTQTVSNGGKAYFTIVSNGGSQVVEAGGSAMHNILFDVNNQTAATGATFINHVVSAENSSVISSTHTITNGKAEYNIFIATHGYQHISSGGLALDTTLNGGGFDGVARQYVYSGGIALSTTVNDLGFVRVSSGGSAISTVISAEGEASAFMTVLAGGYASGIVVQGGTNAKLIVGENDEDKPLYWTAAGGTVYDVTVENGGRAVVYGTNALHGRTVLNSGGTITHGWLNSGESTGTAGTLTVENLVADGGIVRLPVKLDAGSAAAVGHIKITESHSGTAYIDLNRFDDGTATASITDNSFMLVEYSTGVVIAEGATFDLVGGAYTAGAYEYTLNKSTDSADRNYYLRTDGKLTQGANNAGSTPGMAGAAAGAALNSLQKRLGDLRGMGSTAARHGIWGRSYYKNMTLKAYEDVKMDVSGIEAGYDFKLSGYDYSGDNYRNNGLYLGLMAANIDISADGKGSGEGLLGGGYATYLAENGWFADFTLRSGRTEIEVYTFPNAGGKIVISPERAFIAASMETGYTADLRNSGKGWKVEPKAELQYMRMGSKDTETNTHIPVQYGGAEYYTGIGTIYASYTSMRQNGMMTEPFAEITYKYEFDGKEKVQYQTANMTSDTGGGTVEGRIGVNMQLTSGLYWHAAASYEDGHSVKSYGADAGIRYSFGGK